MRPRTSQREEPGALYIGALENGARPVHCTLDEALISAWQQALAEERPAVEIDGRTSRVGRTRSQSLRTVEVVHGDRRLEGIEQNPNTASRWAKLAQEGKRIMQFRYEGRYVANVCEGQLRRYPSWKATGLPE